MTLSRRDEGPPPGLGWALEFADVNGATEGGADDDGGAEYGVATVDWSWGLYVNGWVNRTGCCCWWDEEGSLGAAE